MNLLRNLLAGGARGGMGAPGKVVFVSYGAFDSNSGGHIAGFAAELCRLGKRVAVCARDDVFDAYAFGPAPYEIFSLKALTADPQGVLAFDGAFDARDTALICWTPRKASRRAVLKVTGRWPVPYIVHLEDNEALLSELRAAEPGQQALEEDAAERDALLAGASGVTIIEERLRQTVPAGLPVELLEPGVDIELFSAPLPPWRRASLLRAAGAPEGAKVLVYSGNIHRANADEMAELYKAVRLLREAGVPLVLLRTGKDDVDMTARLGFDPAETGVLSLGIVPRPMLVDLLKCADLFVQPGAPGPFNDYRLPSKLPEFMAVGRPLVLPAANLGLRLRDGEEALLLHTGTAEEIAGRVRAILADAALASRLAAGAQAFARGAWVWEVQGRRLADFLERVCAPLR